MLRRLRIAVSVFFAVVALVLTTFCVRSFTKYEVLQFPLSANTTARILTIDGRCLTIVIPKFNAMPPDWDWRSGYIGPEELERDYIINGFQVQGTMFGSVYDFSLWIPSVVSLSLAMVTVIPFARRFSLQALLIITTLVAVVLGLGVWLAR